MQDRRKALISWSFLTHLRTHLGVSGVFLGTLFLHFSMSFIDEVHAQGMTTGAQTSETPKAFLEHIARQELLKVGKKGYEMRCAGCHGIKGDGNGPSAAMLNPRPRNFKDGLFKFRSTPISALPTDDDLMHVITYGILGTSMPAFELVPKDERYAIAQYIKTFSEAWKDPANYEPPVTGSPFPAKDFAVHDRFIERARNGKEIYANACAVCHGIEGKGNGPSAALLKDHWGYPIKPANLTKPYIKSGRGAKAIYRTLIAGVAGAPMPAFKSTYTDDELWDVTAYILYLRGKAQKMYPEDSPPIEPIPDLYGEDADTEVSTDEDSQDTGAEDSEEEIQFEDESEEEIDFGDA
jgi:cytochrome c oxidase cbb3-type subunit 2